MWKLVLCGLLAVPCPASTQAKPRDTALLEAARTGDVASVRRLLTKGANANTRNKEGETALMLAARTGQMTNVRLLLDHGARVNARDKRGTTALLGACSQPFLDAGRNAFL